MASTRTSKRRISCPLRGRGQVTLLTERSGVKVKDAKIPKQFFGNVEQLSSGSVLHFITGNVRAAWSGMILALVLCELIHS